MKKALFFFYFLTTIAYAQTSSSSGLSFLKLGSGAKNIAMSDLGVVGNNDLSSAYYNPSLLIHNNTSQISFTHNSLYIDLSSEVVNASFRLFGIPFVLGLNTTTISNIEVRSRPGEIESTFNANYFSAGISTAFSFWENINTGITFKFIYENLFSDEASGFGIDLGATYSALMDNFTLGASLRNIGSMNQLRLESTKLPIDLRAGAQYKLDFNDYMISLNSIAGIQKYLHESGIHAHLGGELSYNKSFFLRIGFISGHDSKNLSTGFGILWKSLNIDYAYVPVKYGLGDYHILTFIYTFDN
ncbi:MAG: PorV/PorQ family protein [Ignavibacteria bacterium]|nr:PorV/PorQ family protein [Ignavibacteria bacterium]